MSDRAATFEHYRSRLFGIAYRMLGGIQDAEDVVQDAYLRWHQADVAHVRAPEGWLVAVTTRLSIDRLRRASVERARYVGEWLPEPIATGASASPDREMELASDLSVAFLAMLERLSPVERAALLLRDVYDVGYPEIARTLEKGEAAVRQLVHRARTRVRGERVRQRVAPEVTERLLERFIHALRNDDQETVLALVADDATWTSDSGGLVPAARNVLLGSDRISRFVLGLARKYRGRLSARVVWVNGEPAIGVYAGDEMRSVTAVRTDGERLLDFFQVLNPGKLRYADVLELRGGDAISEGRTDGIGASGH